MAEDVRGILKSWKLMGLRMSEPLTIESGVFVKIRIWRDGEWVILYVEDGSVRAMSRGRFGGFSGRLSGGGR
ncbi:MAG TPA: hypothetical protein VFW44_13660 [Bryobacteraceae bacterium]|nr:hypothetical protein [Bryobacteraceae bacterium]